VDPKILQIIKKIVVSNPHGQNYLDFRAYEEGLVEAGVSVVAPLTQEILAMQVPAGEVGSRLNDIGGTPARVLLGIGERPEIQKHVEESIHLMLTALKSENDQVALETKWYLICVLAEMTR